jgi:putative transposase
VSTSASYAWTISTAQPSQAQQDQARLVAQIRRIHAYCCGVYGSPRVAAKLPRRGVTVNHKRVEGRMRTHGILGHRPRRRHGLTRPDPAMPPAPDLLGRLFDPDQLNVAWCRDVTSHPHR